MAISSQSIIHKPLDYIQPVDLNLLGKVIQYKQSQFDAGTKQVQSHIDALASMDVAKDTDRQYLNEKLSNLVNTVNSIGGADFSDPNTANQIAGLSGQIYGDDNVISAVSNTKKLRYVQKAYQDLKEKKPDDWNPANEAYDMGKFEKWLSDGSIGTSPDSGAGEVTPYNKYEDSWVKMFEKIKSNTKTDIYDKGLMYRIDTQEYVTPEQIWSAAAKLLTPGQRKQIGIEGRYAYRGIPPQELLKAYDDKQFNKLNSAQDQLEDYQTKRKGAISTEDQEKYGVLVQKKQAEIDELLAPIRLNQEQIKEKLYLDEKLSGLADRFSFTKSTTKLQPATDKMFAAKHLLDQQRFLQDQQNDSINQMIEIAKEGLMWSVDPFGNKTLVIDPTSPARKEKGGDISSSLPIPGVNNANAEQTKMFSKEKLDQRKTDLVAQKEKAFSDFANELNRTNEITDVLIADMQDGHLSTKVSPEIQKIANDMMSSWEALTRGDKVNYEALPASFRKFAGAYQEAQKEIESIDNLYKVIDKQVADRFGITTADKAVVDTYNKFKNQLAALDIKYNIGKASGNSNVMVVMPTASAAETKNPKYVSEKQAILNKMQALEPFMNSRVKAYQKDRAKETENQLANINKRFNTQSLPQADTKDKSVSKMIADNAGTLEWYNEDGTKGTKQTLAFQFIEPMKKGYEQIKTPDGYKLMPVMTFTYKPLGAEKDTEIRKVPLTPEQAAMFGFGKELKPMSGYEFGLQTLGSVKDIITTTGRNYTLKYDIVKTTDDQNNPEVFVRVKKPDGSRIIISGRTFRSYERAIEFMESQTNKESIDEAFKHLEALNPKN